MWRCSKSALVVCSGVVIVVVGGGVWECCSVDVV